MSEVKTPITINQQELINLLNEVKSSTFVHLVTETPVRMNKTGNPYFGRVIKRSSSNYLMGNDYEKRVQSNEKKEGLEPEFEVEEMKGKKHISKVVCVDTKTETTHYLMVERFDEVHPTVEYKCDGNPIEKVLFESFMGKVYESTKQVQDRKVMVITPKIENIRECTFGGNKYIIQ